MRGLFLRIFLSFWLAMTVIGVGFALIYAAAGPSRLGGRRAAVVAELLAAEGELVVAAAPEAAARRLARLARTLEIPAVVFAAEGAPMGDARALPGARALAEAARRSGGVERRDRGDSELVAVPIEGGVIVGAVPRISRWERFISPSTLPERLFVVFLVAGLVSFLLARFLTRPLRHLRRAAQRMADGDLSVRVARELGSGGEEVSALGRDFDRMAERIAGLLEAQQRLLRDVSHELRSPLARLHVALELARSRAGGAAAAPLDRIEREAERLGELIGHILTLSRLDGSTALPREPLDLGALVADVVADADYEGRSEGRRVELVATQPCQVTGHAEVLRWAIDNVLRNAVRFTAEGTAVEVQVTREAPAGRPVAVVRVRDHGPGVPEAELASIFKPFYRIGTDRDRKSGGTGVGLAITERGVRLHGGAVTAANAEGGGLVVTIELPA